MTEEEYRRYINEACDYAGKGDSLWNQRFIDALGARGLVLYFGDSEGIPGFCIWAPMPFDMGWKFDYPAYIVPRSHKE